MRDSTGSHALVWPDRVDPAAAIEINGCWKRAKDLFPLFQKCPESVGTPRIVLVTVIV